MLPFLERPDLAAQVIAERTRLIVPSLPHWIEPTVEFLRRQAVQIGACTAARSFKLLLALHEALSNSVLHGNLELSSELKEISSFADALARASADPRLADRVVEITVDYNSRRCRWIMTDQGPGFDVRRVLSRCLHADVDSQLASGRGILLMHSFMDEVKYKLGGRRVILTLKRAGSDGGLNSGELLPSSSPIPPGTAVERAVAELIEDLSLEPQPPDDRRAHQRVAYHERIEVVPPPPSAPLVGFARDLSRGGIAFLSNRSLNGDILVVLPARVGTPVRIRAHTTRCNMVIEGMYDVGARFLELESA